MKLLVILLESMYYHISTIQDRYKKCQNCLNQGKKRALNCAGNQCMMHNISENGEYGRI